MRTLTTVYILPLEPLEEPLEHSGSAYGHNMVLQSPQSARFIRQSCIQHYYAQPRHTFSIVGTLENVSGIYNKSSGSRGKITSQMLSSIETTLMASQLHWTRYITRMYDSILPKVVLCGELAKRKRLHGGRRVLVVWCTVLDESCRRPPTWPRLCDGDFVHRELHSAHLHPDVRPHRCLDCRERVLRRCSRNVYGHLFFIKQ